MYDLAPVIEKNKKHVEHAKCSCWNGEEINGDNIFGMVPQGPSP